MTTRRKRRRTEWSPNVTGEEAFRLACAYGLARPPTRHYVVPLYAEDEAPRKRGEWVWHAVRKELMGK